MTEHSAACSPELGEGSSGVLVLATNGGRLPSVVTPPLHCLFGDVVVLLTLESLI